MAVNKKAKTYMESELHERIKSDLMDQLERNGTTGKYYEDLVNDYMDMWISKCLLSDDIKQRGVIVKYDNGGGQKGKKKNESVELFNKVNAQMLKLLTEIGIKPSQAGEGDEEEM